MMRKPTKNTRGPNAAEKRFMQWIKEQPCCNCGHPGPSIVDHCEGSTFRHMKVLVGHWFLIPLCVLCDKFKTLGNHRAQKKNFKRTNSDLWCGLVQHYPNKDEIPPEVYEAISKWRR